MNKDEQILEESLNTVLVIHDDASTKAEPTVETKIRKKSRVKKAVVEDEKVISLDAPENSIEDSTEKGSKKKKAKKPEKVLTKKQNIIIWCSVSALGIGTGGGIGGFFASSTINSRRVLEDTSVYMDSFTDIYDQYEKWDLAKNSSLIDSKEYDDNVVSYYNTSITKGTASTDVTDYLSVTDILQIAFYNLENYVEEYVTESIGSLITKPGVGTQYLTSVHGRKGNLYYFENDSTSPVVKFGMRYTMVEGEEMKYYSGDTKNITDTEKDGNHIIQCFFDNSPTSTLTDEDYTTSYGCSLKDPCVYLISSKTVSKEEEYAPKIEKLDEGGYYITCRFTKKACQDYITQIINSSGGKVSNVLSFPNSDWEVKLDDNLLPTWRTINETYITNALGLSVTCISCIEENFYYDNVEFPEPNNRYVCRLLK